MRYWNEGRIEISDDNRYLLAQQIHRGLKKRCHSAARRALVKVKDIAIASLAASYIRLKDVDECDFMGQVPFIFQ